MWNLLCVSRWDFSTDEAEGGYCVGEYATKEEATRKAALYAAIGEAPGPDWVYVVTSPAHKLELIISQEYPDLVVERAGELVAA